MNPVSIIPAIAALLLALSCMYFLPRRQGNQPQTDHFGAIDGLRGYLAFFVFLHHACIWYFYIQTNVWDVPPSNLYTNFGQSSVALFFMITGLLFFSKILDKQRSDIDWLKIFVSRVLRIVPLYVFVMALLFVVIARVSHGVPREHAARLIKEALEWAAFTIPGRPDINGEPITTQVVAGVVWSLPYEWVFYLSLPLLALLTGAKVPLRYSAVGFAGVGMMLMVWHPKLIKLLPFAGGMLAAVLSRMASVRAFARTRLASCLSIACIAIAATAFPTAYLYTPLLLLSLAFILIAAGNDIFGILSHTASKSLGEIAYSIYLLHGIVLFTCFYFVIGLDNLRKLGPIGYWSLIVLGAPLLVTLCATTFSLIERPAMRKTSPLTAWLRMKVARR